MKISYIKQNSKNLLQMSYGLFILVHLVYTILTLNVSPTIDLKNFTMTNIIVIICGLIVNVILTGVFEAGLIDFILNLNRYMGGSFTNLFSGFKKFGKFFSTYLLTKVLTFLWSLLFIIPGIIKGLAYSQALYIMHDNQTLSAKDAIYLSRQMMHGHKKEFFFLNLSFIGWFILSGLT